MQHGWPEIWASLRYGDEVTVHVTDGTCSASITNPVAPGRMVGYGLSAEEALDELAKQCAELPFVKAKR